MRKPSDGLSRRAFVSAALWPLAAGGCAPALRVGLPNVSAIPDVDASTWVNDVHSQMNATRVAEIIKPQTTAALQSAVKQAAAAGRVVSVAGGRHAMGGQQFADDAVLIDSRGLNRVLSFDAEAGLITVEGGIQWPGLLAYLERSNASGARQWGIFQKQTGADRLSLGGALSCNAHGRGLTLKPIIDQVASFDLIGPDATVRRCSRTENRELFGLAIGGYGLFGLITQVQLQLRPRVKVRRIVELAETSSIIDKLHGRIRDGYLYGDYQFATDSSRDSFLRRGVFSCYQPVSMDTPLTEKPTRFNPEDWARLTYYSHRFKQRAFQVFSSRYLATAGQVYWADWQLSAAYVDNYHADLDRAFKTRVKATEMITEIYVSREKLAAFMEDARVALIAAKANVVYGTVRLIEQDEESFLAWARQPWACVIFNLHVEHEPAALAAASDAFRALIDAGITQGGSYYLTYHRWARRDQVERCYPRMREFLASKRRYDPDERFQSTWYQHHKALML
ncbi:MAG TPA: FAD-binding oxidoreductase [Vicinamibacterales bacterium]|nr:FAD-binding oxidoreductase [Vicinamibacterales bacterium]